MNLKDLPITAEIVCCEYDGWIVGSSADPEKSINEIKDIDIIVPFHQWRKVSKIIASKNSTVNKHGGLRFIEDNIEIDIWPDILMEVLKTYLSKWIWQPRLNIRFKRVNDEIK